MCDRWVGSVDGVDFDGGSVGIGVEKREDGVAVEGGERREPAHGVDVFRLWESVDLEVVWSSCCYCHC